MKREQKKYNFNWWLFCDKMPKRSNQLNGELYLKACLEKYANLRQSLSFN